MSPCHGPGGRLQRRGFAAAALLLVTVWLMLVSRPVAAGEPPTSEERAWLVAHPQVRVGIEAWFPPFVFLDEGGRARGISVDLLGRIGPGLGLRFDTATSGDFSALMNKLRAGEIDVLTSVMKTEERSGELLFTRPYVSVPAVILVRKDREGTLVLDDLRGLKVAVGRGYGVESFLRSRYPHLALVPVANDREALRRLSFGDVGAVISDVAGANYLLKVDRIDNIRVAGDVGFRYDLSFAVPRGAAPLRDALDRGLADLPDNQRREIVEGWTRVAPASRPSWWWGVAGLAVLGGLVLGVRRLVAARRLRPLVLTRRAWMEWALPAGVLLTGLTLTFAVYRSNRQATDQLIQTRFDLRASGLERDIELRLMAYEQVLRGARGLFAASDRVDRRAFAAYVRSLAIEDQFPGIQGVGFALALRPEELAAHVAEVRREVAEPVYEPHPGGERSLYTSIVYLEPFRGRNLRAFGYDMLTEPVRREALERARDADLAAVSGKVRLVQETETGVQSGFLMFLPVYRNGAPHESVEERRASLLGWVYAPFRCDDLMAGIRGPLYADLHLDLFDGDASSAEHLLYAAREPEGRLAGRRLTGVRQLQVAGRPWTLDVSASQDAERALVEPGPPMAPAMGLVASLLGALFARLLLRLRARAVELAQAMTVELQQSEAWLRAIYTGTPLAIVRANLEGERIDANPAFFRMLGYDRDELLGKPIGSLTHPDDVEADQRVRRALMSGGSGHALVETRWLRKDGATLWVSLRVQAVQDEAGRPRFLFGIAEDVTERRRIEDELRRVLREREVILEGANAGIVMLVGRTQVWVNRWMEEVTGYAREEMVGRSTRMYYASEAAFEAFGRAADAELSKGLHYETELELLRKDATSIWVSYNGRAVDPHDPSRGTLCVLADITARKEFERQLGAKQGQLEALNRSLEERVGLAVGELRAKDRVLITQGRQAAMGEMLGNIAHQWRQPLNALGLVLSDLKDAARFGELDTAAVNAAVSESNRLIQSMSRTIRDFSEFFRPEKEKVEFSVLEQVAETRRLLDASLRHSEVQLEVEEGPDVRLFGYPNEYSQVLLNLISNAKQAIAGRQPGKGKVTLRLSIRDGFACLTVRDNGGGVPEEIVDRIFEPYFSTKPDGTGIGLYMSRQIVERSMGGRIEVRNVDGGAEFDLLTPLAEAGGRASTASGAGDAAVRS